MSQISHLIIIKIAIAITTFILAGCTKKTGEDYFECMLISTQNPSKSSEINFNEICNQLHPARIATEDEARSIEVLIHDHQSFSQYKKLQITNKNTNFVASEIIITFSNGRVTIPIKFVTDAKPLSISWTSPIDTGIEGSFEAYGTTIKGRFYK